MPSAAQFRRHHPARHVRVGCQSIPRSEVERISAELAANA